MKRAVVSTTLLAALSLLVIRPADAAQTLTSVTPNTIEVGSGNAHLIFAGTGFSQESTVMWNKGGGTCTFPLPTIFLSSTRLRATVPAVEFLTVGSAAVFTLQGGGSQSAKLTITIVAKLAISTTTLPSGTVGKAYTTTLHATGGKTPYKWAIVTGTLPTGLTLNATTGVISGTPTAVETVTFTVRCTDATGTLAFLEFPRELVIGK